MNSLFAFKKGFSKNMMTCLKRIKIQLLLLWTLKGEILLRFSFYAVMEWCPRMDVAESGRTYVITVEIPGVSVKDIRVEVDEKK